MEWGWYQNSNMVHLFIHLLLTANRKPGNVLGTDLERGQAIVGRKKLSEQTGISEQTLRTCITRLKSTKEITTKSTNKYTIVTICNYDVYNPPEPNTNQEINQDSNQQLTSNQPATNQQLTTNNNEKNDNNEKEEKKFSFKKSLIEIGVEENIISDWLKVRAKKKATNTETAFKKLKSEIEKSGATANECIKIAAENSWQGFKAEWMNNPKKNNSYGEYGFGEKN